MEEKLYKIPLTSILSVVGERKQKQSLPLGGSTLRVTG
jgi:hypothetical protein